MPLSNFFSNSPAVPLANKSVGYFPVLTGLRAIAAYLVYLHHFNPFQEFEIEYKTFGYFLYSICNELYIGVTIFFCLSGFLIAHRYLNKVEFNIRWAFNYLRNRFARIYPMYFLLTVITFLFYLQDAHSDYLGGSNFFKSKGEALLIFILNISFLRGFSDTIKFTGVAQGWSLTVEETFYFCAPFILLVLSYRKKWALVFLFIFPTLGVLFVLLFKQMPTLGVMDNYKFMWSYTFFGRCFEFLSGIFLAVLFRTSLDANRQRVFTWVGIIFICICIITLASLKGSLPNGMYTYKGILVNNLFLALAVIVFFYGLLTEDTWLKRILSSKILQLLGKSSYVFYLIHMGFIEVWAEKDLLLFPVGKFLLLNLIAIFLYKFVEEPTNKFLRKRLVLRRHKEAV